MYRLCSHRKIVSFRKKLNLLNYNFVKWRLISPLVSGKLFKVINRVYRVISVIHTYIHFYSEVSQCGVSFLASVSQLKPNRDCALEYTLQPSPVISKWILESLFYPCKDRVLLTYDLAMKHVYVVQHF